MRLVWGWLKDFIEFEGTPDELADALTMNGIEAAGVETVGAEFAALRVGEVLEVRPHPNADNLKLCRVSLGDAERTIVCGAPNVAEEQRVPVVLPGGVLPNGKKIEPARIRGEVSEGMICSAAELGFEDASDGIWVLDPTVKVGASLAEAAGLADHVLELEVTPNRGDCLSVLGIAREVACLKGSPLHPRKPRVIEHGGPIKGLATVSIECPDLCPRYTARVVEDVTVGPSPVWMQWRLRAAGIRPINNIVDATNYVMLERGQPLHAFDLERLEGGRIVVREWTRKDGSFTTLDGVERVPPEGACMICDGAAPVAIGGVMGGLESEVKADTRAILLESAYFAPESVRRTSRALGLSSEASYRFERGVDPAGVAMASDRAAELIRETAGGRVARSIADVYPAPVPQKMIVLRTARIQRVLGKALPIGEVSDILLSLGMEVTATEGQASISIRVPHHRPDLTREVDLIEEVARIHGYDRFPSTLPAPVEIPVGLPSEWEFLAQIRSILAGAGLLEAVNLSFASAQDLKGSAGTGGGAGALPLRNPLTQEGAYLRVSLWPGLLRNAATNMNRGVHDVRLFEVGRVFRPATPSGPETLPVEETRVAALLSESPGRGHWLDPNEKRGFYDIKGILEYLFSSLGIEDVRYEPGPGYPFRPSRSAILRLPETASEGGEGGKRLGEVGEIHPDLRRALDMPQAVILFDVSADLLRAAMPGLPVFRPLPRYPATTRDLAVVIPGAVRADALRRTILEAGAPWVREAVVFDVHVGDPIPDGQKSVAFALTYRAEDRTLSGEEVNEKHESIVARLSEEYGARLR
ncbi:MAG: phenylalanine--tRNA ligase subunit beta [Nitrospinota bacterium]